MYETAFQPRPASDAPAAAEKPRFYVLSQNCELLLVGSNPNDLAPADAAQTPLPDDVAYAVRSVVATHDFSDGYARTSVGSKSLRVLLVSGPAGNFYGVVAQSRARRDRAA